MSIQRYEATHIETDSFRHEGYCGMRPDNHGEYIKYVEFERLLSVLTNVLTEEQLDTSPKSLNGLSIRQFYGSDF